MSECDAAQPRRVSRGSPRSSPASSPITAVKASVRTVSPLLPELELRGERALGAVAHGEDVQVTGHARRRFGLQRRGRDQVTPALVRVAVTARIGGQGEGRQLLGRLRAGVEVVRALRLRVGQTEFARRRHLAGRDPAHTVAVVGGVRQSGEQVRRSRQPLDGHRHPQPRAVGDVQGPDMAQDVVAADDRLGDQLGGQAVGTQVADADLAHGAAVQEAVRDRAEAVLAVDGGRQVVGAARLDHRRGHPVGEGHRDRA